MFNDVEDTGTFSGTNSSEINTFSTQSLTWVRGDFHRSVHGVEVTVVGDNIQLFEDGNIKLKVKLKMYFINPIIFFSLFSLAFV